MNIPELTPSEWAGRLAELRDEVHNAHLRADRANRERNEGFFQLDALKADIRLCFTETAEQKSQHVIARQISQSRRFLDLFKKHPDLYSAP